MGAIGELSKQLYHESHEEYGRLIRLIIGLSAGAITIVSTVLDEPIKSSWLVIISLCLHFFSLCFGLGAQYYLMQVPAKELEEVGEAVNFSPRKLDEYLDFPWPHTLWCVQKNRQPKWLPRCQIVTFLVASVLLVVHFFLQTQVSCPT